jgi:hypothetical protein
MTDDRSELACHQFWFDLFKSFRETRRMRRAVSIPLVPWKRNGQQPRRTPVGNGLAGRHFWIVATNPSLFLWI